MYRPALSLEELTRICDTLPQEALDTIDDIVVSYLEIHQGARDGDPGTFRRQLNLPDFERRFGQDAVRYLLSGLDDLDACFTPADTDGQPAAGAANPRRAGRRDQLPVQ